jgi:hypothetical protein
MHDGERHFEPCELALLGFVQPLACAITQQDDTAVGSFELGLARNLTPLV